MYINLLYTLKLWCEQKNTTNNENTNLKGDFALKIWFNTFVLKISDNKINLNQNVYQDIFSLFENQINNRSSH